MKSEKDLRVCLANDSFPPLIDGVANTVVNYAAQIEQKYGSALVATPRYPGVTDDYPFRVLRYPSLNTVRAVGYRTGNPFAPSAMQKLTEFAPDIIHSHCPFASTLLARELREITGAPLVFTYHTKFDIDINRAVRLGIVKDMALKLLLDNISACDEVWVVNRGAGENLVSLGYTGDYRIMPNGVDFPPEAAPEAAVRALDAQYSLDSSVPLFLFVGRMMWYKGQRIILDGLRTLRDAGHAFRMVFVGDGDDLEAIKKYASVIGLSRECLFTGAIRDRELLRAWYSRADLFLLPSVFDNNPIVVKEAAACGTASVLIRGSSSAEGATDGRNALLIREDPADLAAALCRVCEEPGRAAALGAAAQRELYVSWDDMIASAIGRYRELIDASAAGELPRRGAKLSSRAMEALGDLQVSYEKFRELISQGPEYSHLFSEINTIRPPMLREGDTIGIISPCNGMREEKVAPAADAIRAEGFAVKFGKNTFSMTDGYAASAAERAEDFDEMIADPEVKMILFPGGEISNEILPLIDYDAIREHPKIICSYSDGTTLLEAIHSRTGLVTFYGGSTRSFAPVTEYNLASFRRRLMTTDTTYTRSGKWTVLSEGRGEGVLCGGYLINFDTLINSDYFDLPNEPYLLFLEDYQSFSGISAVSKWLSDLEQKGVFSRATGLIFGHYTEDDARRERLFDVLRRFGRRLGIPVVYTDDYGHGENMSILPIGVRAVLDTETDRFTLAENGTSR